MKRKLSIFLVITSALWTGLPMYAFAEEVEVCSDSQEEQFFNADMQEAYIELIEAYESEGETFPLSYEAFLELYADNTDQAIVVSEQTTDQAEFPTSQDTDVTSEPVSEYPSDSEFASAYDELTQYITDNNIQADLSLETYIDEFNAIGCSDLQTYNELYYSTLNVDLIDEASISTASLSGKWWLNTGTSLPQAADYSKYNLLGTVRPGDIIYENQGLGGLTGHIAIVEGTFYSSTYKQFYVRIIEAVSTGVCRGVLDDTRMDEKEDYIYRVNGANQSVMNKAVNFCISQLGKSWLYDSQHNTSSSESTWYCSELIYAAYYNQGYIIKEDGASNGPGILPRDIISSSSTTQISLSTSKPSTKFEDISSHWGKTFISYVADNGIMPGVTTSYFRPDYKASRGVTVSVLYKLAGSPTTVYTHPFTDVASSSSYHLAVAWAYNNKITAGTSSTTFSPNSTVTREQFVTFLYKFASLKGYSTSYSSSALKGYTDTGNISSYAVIPMKWAVSKGLITGRTTTTIVPEDTCNRAEIATMIYKFVQNLM